MLGLHSVDGRNSLLFQGMCLVEVAAKRFSEHAHHKDFVFLPKMASEFGVNRSP